jgi:hypothetical protein
MLTRIAPTGCGLFAALALLAGCGGGSSQSGVIPASVHPMQGHAKAWMSPDAKKKSKLLYVSAFNGDHVDVYDFPSDTQVGTLTGFSSPNGQCVDAKGDVYITDGGTGVVSEYAHGGQTPIKTYTTSGGAYGCSVDRKGDLAVTDFTGPSYTAGSITVFRKGSGKGIVYDDPVNCYYIWPGGYDDKGNLVAIAESQASETVTFCALLKGSKSLTTLSADGFTIDSPDSTMWDGKYLALGDQQLGGGFQSGIVEATVSGSTLSYHAQVPLNDDCDGGYSHVIQPFIVGRKNTPVNHTLSHVVAGSDDFCSADLRFWHYPAGGDPYKAFTFQAQGESVSIIKTR